MMLSELCAVNAPPSWPWSGCSLAALFRARTASVGLPAETHSGVCSPAQLLKTLCLLAPAASSPLQVVPKETNKQTVWHIKQETPKKLLHSSFFNIFTSKFMSRG